MRYYVTLANGDEAARDFSFAGGFTVSFGSAAMQSPAQVAIAPLIATVPSCTALGSVGVAGKVSHFDCAKTSTVRTNNAKSSVPSWRLVLTRVLLAFCVTRMICNSVAKQF